MTKGSKRIAGDNKSDLNNVHNEKTSLGSKGSDTLEGHDQSDLGNSYYGVELKGSGSNDNTVYHCEKMTLRFRRKHEKDLARVKLLISQQTREAKKREIPALGRIDNKTYTSEGFEKTVFPVVPPI